MKSRKTRGEACGALTAGVSRRRGGRLISCLDWKELCDVTKLRLSAETHGINRVCALRHACVLHTLLAATLHRLLHVLRERGPVVAFEGEPPASDPQRGAAGRGCARLGSRLAPTPAFDPGERFGRLAEGGAALQPVVISERLASTRRL